MVVAAQDFPTWQGGVSGKPFGLTFLKGSTEVQGPVTGMPEVYAGKTGNYSGGLFSAQGDGWETVATVGDRPLVLRKPLGKGMVYVYLGRWMWQGADALRGVLAYAGRQAAPLVLDKPDDQLEYVAYRKGRGAWVALFNHGNIVIGCDRLDPAKWRVAPPEPLLYNAPRPLPRHDRVPPGPPGARPCRGLRPLPGAGDRWPGAEGRDLRPQDVRSERHSEPVARTA